MAIQKFLRWVIQLLVVLAALGFLAQNTAPPVSKSLENVLINSPDEQSYLKTVVDRVVENVQAWDYLSPPQAIATYAHAARMVIDDHITNFNIPPPKPFNAKPGKTRVAKAKKGGKGTAAGHNKGKRTAKGKAGSKGLTVWGAE